jgi:oxygen-independent coproporphyrinogen-3 oxidase
MANLYIHFPFCKQACHYCNFHFSTSTSNRTILWEAIVKEYEMRKNEILLPLESIYFGGGSPSLLSPNILANFIQKIKKNHILNDNLEITLEVNPDDVNPHYLKGLLQAGINRLSVGIQSFHQSELSLMNRAHNKAQIVSALDQISKLFPNFSLDLIYGMPSSTLELWKENIQQALTYNPPHISAYALTVESKTALDYLIKSKKIELVDDDLVKEQYDLLVNTLMKKGFINYEFSNFGLPGYYSINNQNYWTGKPYVGLGPSAHSYDGKSTRSWNKANNTKYLKAITDGILPFDEEQLSRKDRFNEYVMTGLRTYNGISLDFVKQNFGVRYGDYLEEQMNRHLKDCNLYWDGDNIKVTQKAKFLTDGIASDLFKI